LQALSLDKTTVKQFDRTIPLETLGAMVRTNLSAFFLNRPVSEVLELQRAAEKSFLSLGRKKTFAGFRDGLRYLLLGALKEAQGHPELLKLFWRYSQPVILRWPAKSVIEQKRLRKR
jgi:hypothetical protein